MLLKWAVAGEVEEEGCFPRYAEGGRAGGEAELRAGNWAIFIYVSFIRITIQFKSVATNLFLFL